MPSNRARRLVLAALVAAFASALAPRLHACAACGCGDPTLTSAGLEQPFAGRLRTSLELRYRTDALGQPPTERYEIREFRAEASLAWAPDERFFLIAAAPFVYRTVTAPSLARTELVGIGDVELRAKGFVYKDRELAPRWLLAGVAGVKLPTAPWHEDDGGERLPFEAQPGTGSWDALLGVALTTFQGRWSGVVSAHGSVPIVTREPFEPGPSLRTTVAAQYQVTPWLALRPVFDGRADGITKEGGEEDPNSGGFVAFAGGDVLVAPFIDWTLSAGARVPVWNALRGDHREGSVVMASVTTDW